MILNLLNTATGLKPLYDEDYEEKKKLKIGRIYRSDITEPRNIKFHRKFFSLIKLGHDNTKLEMPFEAYRALMLMKAGYVDVYELPDGKKMALAQSISFANMDNTKFEKAYYAVLNVVGKDIGVDNEALEAEVLNYLWKNLLKCCKV